jgi:glycosyltransferase involved in cell wall biosynthesis
MNIVILQHSFSVTTIGWMRALEARGHRVLKIVSHGEEPYGGWPPDLNVKIVPNDARWGPWLGRRLLRGRKSAVFAVPRVRDLRRAIATFDADAILVEVHSLRNILALSIALTLRVRRVAWIEQVPPMNLEWRILRRLGVLPRRMFTPLDARPGGIAQPLDPPTEGMPVISYAPVIPEIVTRESFVGRPVRILTVASFWKAHVKRPFWTLEAAHDAGLLDGRATFTFVGLGKPLGSTGAAEKYESQRILAELIDELDIAHLVDIRVNVPYLDMPAVYDAHDLLILPSSREQFGMVVPEAMAHGLAVVASDCVGSRGCIVPGQTGELFCTDDRQDLARVLRDLGEDPEQIARMGAAGRDFIRTHAGPAITAQRLEGLF